MSGVASDIVVLSDARPTARKSHVCGECGRRIDPGERYRRQGNVAEGRRYTWKACAHCDAIWDEIWFLAPSWKDEIYEIGTEVEDWEWIDADHALALLCLRQRWRRPDGTLYDVPVFNEEAVS